MTTELILPQPLPGSLSFAAATETEWLAVADLEKAQAEQLLDWLENHGYEQREVCASADGRLAVRFRETPAATASSFPQE